MPAPTVTYAGTSNITDTGAGALTESVASVSWSSGDIILVLGVTEDNTNLTLNAPTNANLTFAALAGLPTNTASSSKGYGWSATAGSAQSAQTIAATHNVGSGGACITVFVISGSTTSGLGTPVVTISTASTHSVTRVGNNSAICTIFGDWGATLVGSAAASPVGGTIRTSGRIAGAYTAFVISWPDQGASGTTSYGLSSFTSTANITKISVEVKGSLSKSDPPRFRRAHSGLYIPLNRGYRG